MRRNNLRKKKTSQTGLSTTLERFSLSIKKPTVKRRRCLMCGKPFLSKGPHNRRCKKCHQKVVQAGENTFHEPQVYSVNYRSDESLKDFD